MQYRADIDGLRALSVLLVLSFHFGFAGAPGGFIGVDVFFVISGYLITGLLLDDLRGDRFSLVQFYDRRLRRILPALLATVLFTLVAGWFTLWPSDYSDTARSALASILAASNLFFLTNTGYFDRAADLAPLLHTWSLGVEEQFYLVWPLTLAGVYRLARGRSRAVLACMAAIIVVSFAFNVWQTTTSPKAAFFLPFSRAWELAIGACLTLFRRPSRWVREAFVILGVALISSSALLLTPASSFPGLNALAPVIGAALALMGGRESFFGRLLGARPIAAIGRISYSLYLAHWPILALWRHYSGANPSTVEALALVAASFAAAFLSYRIVEQPFRRVRATWRDVYLKAAAACFIVASLAAIVVKQGGAPGRIPPEQAALRGLDVMWAWTCPQIAPIEVTNYADPAHKGPLCAVGAPWSQASRRAIIWGDSNAEHLMPLLDIVAKRESVSIALVNPCPAILREGGVERFWREIPKYSEWCGEQRRSVLALLSERPDIDTVFLSARWSGLPGALHRGAAEPRSVERGLRLLEEGLDETMRDIAPDKKLVLFLDVPRVPLPDPASCALTKGALLRRPCDIDLEAAIWTHYQGVQRQAHDALKAAAAKRANVIVIDASERLCADARCRTRLDGEFLYRDAEHLRRNLPEQIKVELADLLRLGEALSTTRGSAAHQ